VLTEPLPLFVKELEDFLGVLGSLLLVENGDFLRPPCGNGLQVLGTHDRACASPACETVPVTGNAGYGIADLPGRSDIERVDTFVAQILLDQFAGLDGVLPPDKGRVAELDGIVAEHYIDRAARLSFEDYCIVAALLEVGRPVSGTGRLQVRSGKRTFGDHAPLAVPREIHPLERADGENKLVLR